jgi:methylmalonyl-CoA/ethylmalonyl-CoA epimerase
MNETETAEAIVSLSASDEPTRARAAAALYETGSYTALGATVAWREDPELAALFAGHPTVGVAVQPETFERIRAANGSPALADVPPDQDAREFELEFAGGVSLDILTTREPHGAGTIARFLDRRGEGIQQVELPVKDVDQATSILRGKFSLQPVYPETRPGADGTRVNFFLVTAPSAGKVLIELVGT